ncbi:hypothetical protein [Burkholderia dolosa]|uniref:hypothetical protein n=1 Tax=Burkholderia dolosa TaxID=152500 RepID=UPI0015921661|nr:hypothetical protein [Burkholderia dolosa]MBY4754230.1 hypothetical protein [Burkholderia dolosa]
MKSLANTCDDNESILECAIFGYRFSANDFYRAGAYFCRLGGVPNGGRGRIVALLAEKMADMEPFHVRREKPVPIRCAVARSTRARPARSARRASRALSGRVCLLRATPERGMIDQFDSPPGAALAGAFHSFISTIRPCPSITRRFPVPSSCRSTRSCPKNRC